MARLTCDVSTGNRVSRESSMSKYSIILIVVAVVVLAIALVMRKKS